MSLKVLMVTSEWPTAENPEWVPFLVQRVKQLRLSGVDIEVFPFRGAKNPFNYMKAWMNLRRCFPPKKFDLVDAQFGQSGVMALPAQVPLTVTYHGSDLQGYLDTNGKQAVSARVLRQISRLVSYLATEIVLVSDHLSQYLPTSRKYTLVPCGIDMELFRPLAKDEARRRLKLEPDEKLVLFAANPERAVKRYDLAKRSMAQLRASNVRLLVASNVLYRQMPLYMNASDCLLLTSRHEGSPTVIKEALACNLPIVSVDVGDVRQRLQGVAGCVVCDDDQPETIAGGLNEVLQADRRIEGRENVQHLDIRHTTQQMLRVYERALTSTR